MLVWMVQWCTSWSLAMMAVWQMTAACSRSLLVMVPVGFRLGHEGVSHLRREGVMPHVGLAICVAVHSTHSSLGGIGGAGEGGSLRHELGQVGEAATQTGRQGGEGVEVHAQDVVDTDAIVLGAFSASLECTEEPADPLMAVETNRSLPRIRWNFLWRFGWR